CKRVKRSYKILFKEQVISRVGEVGIDAAVSESKVPLWTVRNLVTNKANILSFSGSQKRKTLNGRGRKEMKPFSHSLVLYMKDERRDNNFSEKLVTTQTVPVPSKLSDGELVETQLAFSLEFGDDIGIRHSMKFTMWMKLLFTTKWCRSECGEVDLKDLALGYPGKIRFGRDRT
ncbi:Sedoheptulokinase, partial [Phytophthora palmivora]